ncbi:hypothetical protein Hbl1158_10305 [Halobaculum sp. CBA1158]|uniref:hypothetical protein n=1 Tax=Halobaculum sp. CBA1158 TaxID=2904243 RepID=UPI001F411B26|nr:hypothetical protein [Halobaculum sp. CBA1158]UIO98926.1 hypothetical protein Hbl1158_10305 [Halobaculum sp. CBA1158]
MTCDRCGQPAQGALCRSCEQVAAMEGSWTAAKAEREREDAEAVADADGGDA